MVGSDDLLDIGIDDFVPNVAAYRYDCSSVFQPLPTQHTPETNHFEHENSISQTPECREIDLYSEYGEFSQSCDQNPADIEKFLSNEPNRFPEIREGDIQASLENGRCANTDRCTKWAVDILAAWIKSIGHISTPVHELCTRELNDLLAKFFLAARKLDTQPYPARSLNLIACSILRYLRSWNRWDCNFFDRNNVALSETRAALDSRMKEVTMEKVGVNIKHADGLTVEDEKELWRKGECEEHSSRSLLQTVFLYNCKLFGLTAGDEHRHLSVSDFNFQDTLEGTMIIFKGGKCKTFKGGLKDLRYEPKLIEHFVPKDSSPNIASIYRNYFQAIKYKDPFYRRPLDSTKNEPYRYAKIPIGRNTLAKMIKEMCSRAGLQGSFSNHSGKHTAATQLFNAGIDEQSIRERTGHRSSDAVIKYKHKDGNQVIQISNILNPPSNNNPNCSSSTPVDDRQPTCSKYVTTAAPGSSSREISRGTYNRSGSTWKIGDELLTDRSVSEKQQISTEVELKTIHGHLTQRVEESVHHIQTTHKINHPSVPMEDVPGKKANKEEIPTVLDQFFQSSAKNSLFHGCTFNFNFGFERIMICDHKLTT